MVILVQKAVHGKTFNFGNAAAEKGLNVFRGHEYPPIAVYEEHETINDVKHQRPEQPP